MECQPSVTLTQLMDLANARRLFKDSRYKPTGRSQRPTFNFLLNLAAEQTDLIDMRKKIVAGNWKMNKTLDEALALASEIAGMVKDEVRSDTAVVLCTPFPYLVPVLRVLGDNSTIAVGAQNCSQHEWGAYTGETSALMLAPLKARYVIIGHSERRQYFGEDGPLLAAKVDIALRSGLTPIFCCGEPLEVREKGG